VTVTSDGRVVVLDNIQDFLQFFSSEGGFLRALELKEPWDRDPNYPTGIRPDLDGGVIVHDFNGQPPIVRMDREDRVTAAFQPRFADGKLFRIRSDMQVAGDGSLWTSDGESLLLLDRTGVVQRVLGSVPEADVLGRVARLVLGPADHLYAADRRTGCVHVFDATGERLRVCRPRPEDFDGELSLPSLTVNDAGEVFLAEDGSMGFVRFDPSGERHGIARLALDQVSQDWYAQPGTGRTWVVGYEALFLVESDRSVVRSIVRAPDGTWLREMGPAGVAPDGSIVLATGREWNGSPLRLHVFSAVGDPVRSLDLPPGTATWSPFAFDGKQLAFSVQDPATRASSLVLLDLGTQELRRIAVERSDVLWTPAFAAGGHELWLFDGARRVERYRLE
jgi:sugar lactone lactonase YvrE